MRWDEEAQDMTLPLRAHRPRVMDRIVGPGQRFRHPAEQAEIECRVAIYARQVEQIGRIAWLSHRGEGRSA